MARVQTVNNIQPWPLWPYRDTVTWKCLLVWCGQQLACTFSTPSPRSACNLLLSHPSPARLYGFVPATVISFYGIAPCTVHAVLAPRLACCRRVPAAALDVVACCSCCAAANSPTVQLAGCRCRPAAPDAVACHVPKLLLRTSPPSKPAHSPACLSFLLTLLSKAGPKTAVKPPQYTPWPCTTPPKWKARNHGTYIPHPYITVQPLSKSDH